MAALELLAGATWAKVIAARNGYLVDWLSRIADGFSTWSTAGKPVRMNVARGGGDQVNEGLMLSNVIPGGANQFLQPFPAAFGAVEVDDLEPVRSRINERLPTQRIERDALDIAAAPLVDDRHGAPFDLAYIEKRLIVLRAMGQRECEDVRVAYQQANNALRLLLARKLWRLFAILLIPDPPHQFRGPNDVRPREHRADEAVESGDVHRIVEAVVGKQKRVEFLDLPIGQRSGLDWSYRQVPIHREALSADHAAS